MEQIMDIEYISTTLHELIQTDENFARKNKRNPSGLKGLINKNEKVIFCYYGIVSRKILSLTTYQDICFYVLTDTKFIYPENPYISPDYSGNIKAVMLDRLGSLQVKPSSLLGGAGVLKINSDSLFYGISDSDLSRIANMIQEAKSNLDYNLRSSPKNSNQGDIADQLERLARLHKSGSITDDEYQQLKSRVISS